MHRRRPDSSEQGAALVEMALVAPFLLLLILGIIEFGWLFGQFNDLKHGAREGARFAAVDAGDNAAIRSHVCGAMDLSSSIVTLQVELTDGSTGAIGDIATIEVVASVDSLSGAPLISQFLPSSLTSEIEFRLEQPSDSWGSDGSLVTVSC